VESGILALAREKINYKLLFLRADLDQHYPSSLNNFVIFYNYLSIFSLIAKRVKGKQDHALLAEN
jgi:hypothetical protein